ncbi:VCBS repeat-containing protein [Flavitalea sp.]|nr:FG-GAP-like repeat-containing protein [Flavitalea sp.]
MRNDLIFFAIVCCLALSSCKNDKPVLFDLMTGTGIDFNNVVQDTKEENGFYFRNFYNGGGVAIGDINNDGLADVFLTSNLGDNKLFVNKGDWKFDDISDKAGLKQDSMWSTGVVFTDVNNDGWLDIYVCNSGHMKTGNRRNKLYINNKNLTFTESASKFGLDISAYTTQVSFFDYDLDGDLDCFMINNSPIPVNTLNYSNKRDLPEAEWPVAEFLKGGGDHLFRNDDGVFHEVSKEAGIHGTLISFGLGASVGDLNNDGYPDIFVSNDSYERDFLYINQGNGTFKDELEQRMGHTSFSSMGADVADINNDGFQEIFSTDMLPGDDYRLKTLGAFDNIDLYNSKVKAGFYHQYMMNCLQLNNGDGRFSDIANFSGVAGTDWSWGALMFDADNDGYNDIYVCNGINKDVTNLDFMDFFANDVVQQMVKTGEKESLEKVLEKIPVNAMLNKAYRNLGNLRFADQGEDWGFTQKSFSNGAAYGDLDNDGDLDLIINNENQPAFIYKNNSRELNGHHYLGVSLKGSPKNLFAIGSRVIIYADSQVISRELIPSRGFQSSVDYKLIIGLGNRTKVDSMQVIWPDRSVTSFPLPAIDSVHVLSQKVKVNLKGIPEFNDLTVAGNLFNNGNAHTTTPKIATLFSRSDFKFDKHQEDDHIDFYYERNIPQMLSRQGPRAAVADVNGDGLEDIYIGGAAGRPGQLYIQTSRGFEKKEQEVFKRFAAFEDVAVAFFDANKDGFTDLMIGSGGNKQTNMASFLEHRLYLNDGKGNFTIDIRAFPKNSTDISTIAPQDFDNDGDIDLFVGSSNVPGDYGATPRSYLYENDGKGLFKDISKTKFPALSNAGMITKALWTDLNQDGKKELVLTGLWMAPRIFNYINGAMVELPTNLNGLHGWWQSMEIADLDKDGDMDIVLGNIGQNFYLNPGAKSPVKLWMNDFDDNATVEKILTRTIDGKDVPVFLKRDLQDQLPSLKKQTIKHGEFAKKSIQDLFPGPALKKSVVKEFNYCASIVAINKGNGQFDIRELPARVQLSSVNAIAFGDVNADGNPDIIVGGNQYGFLPQFERLDASFGDILVNNGKGEFTVMDNRKSGLDLRGEIRDIKPLDFKGLRQFIFLQNNELPVVFKLNTKLNHEVTN